MRTKNTFALLNASTTRLLYDRASVVAWCKWSRILRRSVPDVRALCMPCAVIKRILVVRARTIVFCLEEHRIDAGMQCEPLHCVTFTMPKVARCVAFVQTENDALLNELLSSHHTSHYCHGEFGYSPYQVTHAEHVTSKKMLRL